MTECRRYAIYHAPPAGEFARRAAGWLGWDAERGQVAAHPDLGLPAGEMTAEPRRYGFHATIKPPFRLREGQTVGAIINGGVSSNDGKRYGATAYGRLGGNLEDDDGAPARSDLVPVERWGHHERGPVLPPQAGTQGRR